MTCPSPLRHLCGRGDAMSIGSFLSFAGLGKRVLGLMALMMHVCVSAFLSLWETRDCDTSGSSQMNWLFMGAVNAHEKKKTDRGVEQYSTGTHEYHSGQHPYARWRRRVSCPDIPPYAKYIKKGAKTVQALSVWVTAADRLSSRAPQIVDFNMDVDFKFSCCLLAVTDSPPLETIVKMAYSCFGSLCDRCGFGCCLLFSAESEI